MRILAVDPGGTTGIAHAVFSEYGKLPHEIKTEMPVGFVAACMRLEDLMDNEPYSWDQPLFDLVVAEKFTITAATAKKSTTGSKTDIELCGVVKYLAGRYDIVHEEQSPSEAMNFIDDKKLKRLGYWTPGPDHARDATRHLLLAAVKHHVIDARLFLPEYFRVDL